MGCITHWKIFGVMKMYKVGVIFTGGTISMKVDERLKSAIPALSDAEIMATVTGIDRIAEIESVHFGSFPSPHISIDKMFELAKQMKIFQSREDIDGVVITHGTDSLEETAYFLDLMNASDKPVIVTGAMRNGSELGYDGPANLSAAICTACSKDSNGQGVLVVMNNQVYAADEVAKVHTMSLDTFQSPDFGPLGIIDQDQVIYYRQRKYQPAAIQATSHIKVGLVKSVAGDDGSMIHYLIDQGYKGIVVEAMGRGNVPPDMVDGIDRAIQSNVPVVIVSRCLKGRVLDSYGYRGGGKDLRNRGVILGDNMSGQKARIKLMLLLNVTTDMKDLREKFEADLYHVL